MVCTHGNDPDICAACAQNALFGGKADLYLSPQEEPPLCEHGDYQIYCHICAAVGRLPFTIGSGRRSVLIEEGARYQVMPKNEAKLKHRGRFCRVLRVGWRGIDPSGPPDYLVVRFEDNGRQGHVDPLDLIRA